MSLTAEQALRAYAAMMNTLDVSELEPLLADDFHYASQWVFAEIESKSAFLDYIVPKLNAIRKSGASVWVEMGWLDREFPGPCVVMAQGDKDNLIAVVLAQVKDDQIIRLDLCGVPSPASALRTGQYPGLAQDKDLDDDFDEDPGDTCPFCRRFNSPPASDICEHAMAWVWDGEIESLGSGRRLETALASLDEFVSSATDGSALQAMLEIQRNRNDTRCSLIHAAPLPFEEALEKLGDARNASGWSTGGMLSGSGYTVCIPDPEVMERLTYECDEILSACGLKIQTEGLEARRPKTPVDWQLAASGMWSEDIYHSGHIAYYIASPQQGEWVLDAVERNVILDGVTEEDVEEGWLNDDQIQAMWGLSLEEAQVEEQRQIVAFCSGASRELSAQDMATVLYRAVCEAGGKVIDDPDDSDGLVEP